MLARAPLLRARRGTIHLPLGAVPICGVAVIVPAQRVAGEHAADPDGGAGHGRGYVVAAADQPDEEALGEGAVKWPVCPSGICESSTSGRTRSTSAFAARARRRSLMRWFDFGGYDLGAVQINVTQNFIQPE